MKAVAYLGWFGVGLIFKRPATRRARAEWLNGCCKELLRVFEIQVDVTGTPPTHGALISNHSGYLDILVLAGLTPCVFCGKAEIERWPLIGWLATMAGTVFVERGSGGAALKAQSGIQDAVDAGLPVVFFPEGTTTDGEELLPFRSGLLAQALIVHAPVTAAYMRYNLTVDHGPGVVVKDDVNYWGERNMLAHLFKFLSLRGVRCAVRLAPEPIAFVHGADERKEAAVEARTAVVALAREVGVEFPVDVVVAE